MPHHIACQAAKCLPDCPWPGGRCARYASNVFAPSSTAPKPAEMRQDWPLRFPDEHIAVFNGHVNNAHERALAACRRRFQFDPVAMARLEEHCRDGVMAMFNESPTQATRLFATLVFIFVNGLEKPVTAPKPSGYTEQELRDMAENMFAIQ